MIKKCPHCGASIFFDDTAVCPECGAALSDADASDTAENAKREPEQKKQQKAAASSFFSQPLPAKENIPVPVKTQPVEMFVLQGSRSSLFSRAFKETGMAPSDIGMISQGEFPGGEGRQNKTGRAPLHPETAEEVKSSFAHETIRKTESSERASFSSEFFRSPGDPGSSQKTESAHSADSVYEDIGTDYSMFEPPKENAEKSESSEKSKNESYNGPSQNTGNHDNSPDEDNDEEGMHNGSEYDDEEDDEDDESEGSRFGAALASLKRKKPGKERAEKIKELKKKERKAKKGADPNRHIGFFFILSVLCPLLVPVLVLLSLTRPRRIRYCLTGFVLGAFVWFTAGLILYANPILYAKTDAMLTEFLPSPVHALIKGIYLKVPYAHIKSFFAGVSRKGI